ncbi:AAA family ATPase [Thermobifida fusca]|uniref:AAA family ATPase n=1 Tax=Thermobifida fusca TaxID=2021 RepID=UPI0018782553|nr:ATP-binding protein [Thermobifida fusca]QOS59529.1 AAA family ATPase [Thermobifida fusca]
MSRTSIVSIDVRGFRAFGTVPAHFELDAPLTVAHAGNSQGKTSLAEAVEFLLSGRSSRRELLGGAKAEYNDSLRNAHLPDDDDEVFVEAVLRTADGSLHRVRRNLTGDFGRGAECESRLLVDGSEVSDLSSVGLMLADPPVRAPVLLQHILRHALSTEPKQRVAYFKSLLSLSDLDLLRARVAEARKQLEQEPDGPWLQRVATLPTELSDARDRLQAIVRTASSDGGAVVDALSTELREVAGAATGEHYSTLADAKTGLETRAKTKAEALFPTARFVAAPIPSVELEVPDTTAYRDALVSIEGEVARLLPVFTAVLRVDEFAELTASVDCPVCATPEALTPARLDTLRAELAHASNLDQTAATTLASIGRAGETLTALAEFVRAGMPTADSLSETELTALAAKLQDWHLPPTLVRDAHATAAALIDSTQALVTAGREVRETLATLRLAVERRELPPDPATAFDSLRTALDAVRRKRELHAEAVSKLETAIAPVVEERAEIADHRQLLTLLDGVAGLAGDVIRSSERQRALIRLKAAEKALQDASVELLDARFAEMSDTIKSWWLTIRPDELVDFMGVRTRAGGTRFVNLIAALHAEAGTSPVVRDAPRRLQRLTAERARPVDLPGTHRTP